jgi:hypothetical protein
MYLMDKYNQFCVDEAKYHLQRANELLTEGLQDPKKYYDEAQFFYKMMARLFPFFVLLQGQYTEPQPDDSETEDSLSDTQSSIQSDEDSYEPVTPLDHSES